MCLFTYTIPQKYTYVTGKVRIACRRNGVSTRIHTYRKKTNTLYVYMLHTWHLNRTNTHWCLQYTRIYNVTLRFPEVHPDET